MKTLQNYSTICPSYIGVEEGFQLYDKDGQPIGVFRIDFIEDNFATQNP